MNIEQLIQYLEQLKQTHGNLKLFDSYEDLVSEMEDHISDFMEVVTIFTNEEGFTSYTNDEEAVKQGFVHYHDASDFEDHYDEQILDPIFKALLIKRY